MKAFPNTIQDINSEFIHDEGMDLRDYFASRAPKPTDQWIEDSMQENDFEHIVYAITAWNYFYADAMIEARNE